MTGWYVARTKSGVEDRAASHLRNQGYDVYIPKYRRQVRHARQTRVVLRPLFPSYLFVRMTAEEGRWRPINGTVGIIGLVCFGGVPQPMPEAALELIRAREDKSGAVSLAPDDLQRGERVRLREGALSEHVALLEEVSDDRRVVLLMNILGREVRVNARREALVRAS